jgi:hypothetical protein
MTKSPCENGSVEPLRFQVEATMFSNPSQVIDRERIAKPKADAEVE